MVAPECESVEVSERAAHACEFSVGYDGDFLLAQSAMRAQGFVEPGEIMAFAARADPLAVVGATRYHDQIAEPIFRKLEACTTLSFAEHDIDSVLCDDRRR